MQVYRGHSRASVVEGTANEAIAGHREAAKQQKQQNNNNKKAKKTLVKMSPEVMEALAKKQR